MSEFVIEEGGKTRHVTLGRLMTIGRSQSNDLVLKSAFASRRHAWIWRQGDQFIVEDLGSLHGTYVNGQRLTAPRFLRDRDVLYLGDARLVFWAGRSSARDDTPPRGLPQLGVSQVYCVLCGAPNELQARFCRHCGGSLDPSSAGHAWSADHIRTSRPITPSEPVMARPFPTQTTRVQAGIDRRAWILILILAILAVSLVTVLGLLLAYVIL